MAKADKDGWIRHRGGKCPVHYDALVDYRMRDGEIDDSGRAAAKLNWDHIGGCADIMAYRIHKTAEQKCNTLNTGMPNPTGTQGEWADAPVININLRDPHHENPLIWRDRIREIDRTVDALEGERVSLVQRLEGEGLQLLQAKVCGEVQPAEDMSDWRNWKEGDFVEVLDAGGWRHKKGSVIRIEDNDRSEMPINADGIWYRPEMLKFHSRPFS